MSSITSLVPRDSYAALERCTYLNQAALGLIPVPTIDAMDTFLKETAQFGNLYLSDDQEAAILDGVRSAGAELLGTSTDALAVVASASEGLGQVTSLLEPQHGTILLVGSDFPSVTYPWLAAAERRGISLRFIDDRADRDLTQDLVDAVDPATVVVAFSVVQYATGTRVDVGRVAIRAHEVGARVVVDATQLAGAGVVDTIERWEPPDHSLPTEDLSRLVSRASLDLPRVGPGRRNGASGVSGDRSSHRRRRLAGRGGGRRHPEG